MTPQTLQITIEYTTKHNPGTEQQLQQIAESYFRAKGIILEGKVIRM